MSEPPIVAIVGLEIDKGDGISATVENLESVDVAPDELMNSLFSGSGYSDDIVAVLLGLAARRVNFAMMGLTRRKQFVSEVDRLLRSPDPDIACAALQVAAEAALVEFHASVRGVVLRADTTIGVVATGVRALIMLLNDEEPGFDEVVSSVFDRHPTKTVRSELAFSLGLLSDSSVPGIVEILKRLAEDPEVETARYAQIGLARRGDSTHWDRVREGLQAGYAAVEVPVLEAAAALGLPQLCDSLEDLWAQKLDSEPDGSPLGELREWMLRAARDSCCE